MEAESNRERAQSLRSRFIGEKDPASLKLTSKVSLNETDDELAKFILCRLESDASGHSLDFETDPGTIEHIYPENPASEWDEVVSEEVAPRVIYRLGNFTLLERGPNRDIGNGLLDTKVDVYARSRYVLTKQLGETHPDDWALDAVESRQKHMARRAVHLWRSDYVQS